CRPALPTAPAFLVNAQTYGTGKTLLSNAILSLTATVPGMYAVPETKEEQGKVLTAVLGDGPLAILFDNVIGSLKASSDLCMALTAETYRSRVLGKTQIIHLPNRAVWVLNGNNVGVSGDMVR